MSFDGLDVGLDLLDTDTLRVIGLADDQTMANQLKDQPQLAEAVANAVDHIYHEDAPPSLTPDDSHTSPKTNTDDISLPSVSIENGSLLAINGSIGITSSSALEENQHVTSPSSTEPSSLQNEQPSNTNVHPPPPPPPPPPPSSSTGSTITKSPSPSGSTTPTSQTNASVAALQAAYRQQGGVLGALPNATGLRVAQGGVYATAAGLGNGFSGQLIYGGMLSI